MCATLCKMCCSTVLDSTPVWATAMELLSSLDGSCTAQGALM